MADEPGYRRYYPVFLDLVGRLAVVVGGGNVAERKVITLLDYAADVVVVSPDLTPTLDALASEGRIAVERRPYVRGDLAGAFIVVCSTDDEEVNRAVYAEAEAAGCLVNVVDVPELCNFIVPSIVSRGPLQIAVSTAGAAPAVAKKIRRGLEEQFGDEWGDYVELLGEVRSLVMAEEPDAARRSKVFQAIADSDILGRIRKGERPDPQDVYAEFVRG